MNEPLDDEDLIARYRALPRPEPSAALDAAVLAQARAAVRRTRPAWMAPVGAAAALVLAVAVGWQLRGVPLEPVMPQPASETAQSAESAGEAPVDAGAAAPAAAKPTARNQAPAAVVPAAPAPAAQAQAPLREAKAERQRDTEDRATPIAESPPAAARAATAEAPQPAPPAPPPPPAEPAPLADRASKMQRGESAPAPPAPPAPPVADAPPAAPMAAEATLANEVGQSVIDPADLDPGVWIDAIRRLRDAGDVAAARRELRRLLQRHPDIELPEDLRELRD